MQQEGLLRSEEAPQIRTNRVERHVAQVQDSGEADDYVQAEGECREYRDLEYDFKVEDVPGSQDGHQYDRDEDRQEELDGLVHLEEIDHGNGCRKDHKRQD